jgi:hypothetical protein
MNKFLKRARSNPHNGSQVTEKLAQYSLTTEGSTKN